MPTRILLLSLAAAAGVAAPEPRDVSALLRPVVERSGLPALGAALVTSDGLEAIGVAGLRCYGRDLPVAAGDQWHLGSCTKALTATLAARLVEKGVVGWDTTVGDVFGDAVPDVDDDWNAVSLTALLCHRSGAAKNFPEPLWEDVVRTGGAPRQQRRRLVEEVLRVPPAREPDTETVYSNAGYVIAGAMLEAIEDAPWEDLVRREVFLPLGMTRTGFGAPGTPGLLDQPLGHVRAEHVWTPQPAGPAADNPPATGPAGTVHTTLEDWGRFARAHLRGERGEETFLAAATWKRLHAAAAGDGAYAPGFAIAEPGAPGGVQLRHLGSNGFWVAEISLSLERDYAVLLVTNVADDSAEPAFQEIRQALIEEHLARAK